MVVTTRRREVVVRTRGLVVVRALVVVTPQLLEQMMGSWLASVEAASSIVLNFNWSCAFMKHPPGLVVEEVSSPTTSVHENAAAYVMHSARFLSGQ